MRTLIRKIIGTFALAAMFAFSPFSLSAQDEVNWNTSVNHLEDNLYEVVFKAAIRPGLHLYDLGPYKDPYVNITKFHFGPSETLSLETDPYHITQPTPKYEPAFGEEIGYFYNKAEFGMKVRLEGEGGVLNGTIDWAVCDDTGCLPPQETEFSVKIGNVTTAEINAVPETASTGTTGKAEKKSLWGIILEALGWGFVAVVMPCVFPMIPMTVSFFMNGAENKKRARFRASAFGIFIVALYTLPIAIIILVTWLIGGDAVTADIFNWLATHWIPNILFFLLFMVFAASFLGAFEITMPSKLVNKSDRNADKGGLAGVFFMALTLVLVSFSCTGPIVGSVLIKATSGEFWEPIITMLVFSVAFAIPFVLFAFFPSLMTKMKSGSWMNTIKVVFGFVILAFGFKFLSTVDKTYHWGILDREIFLAIWIVIFTLLGFYLLGKLKFKHDGEVKFISVPRFAFAVICFSFVVYMIPGMWGAPLKGLSAFLPPLSSQDFVLGQDSGQTAAVYSPTTVYYDETAAGLTQPGQGKYSDFLHLPHGLSGFYTMKEGMEYSKAVGKPIFIDFSGHGCSNCREMEGKVWTDPAVKKLLQEEFVIVALFGDDKGHAAEEDWITLQSGRVQKTLGRINSSFVADKYGIASQPAYVICDSEGNALLPVRGFNLDVQGYAKFLHEGIEAYKKLK